MNFNILDERLLITAVKQIKNRIRKVSEELGSTFAKFVQPKMQCKLSP